MANIKHSALVAIVVLVSGAFSFAQIKTVETIETQPKKPRVSQAKNPAEKELEEFEFKLSDALVSKDLVAIDKLIAADFTIAGSNIDKKAYLEIAKAKELSFDSIEKSEMRIRIYGETAVVSGRTKVNRKIENGLSSSVFNFMNVWVKSKNGDGQCVGMSNDGILLIFSY